jgi:hypothetical protein
MLSVEVELESVRYIRRKVGTNWFSSDRQFAIVRQKDILLDRVKRPAPNWKSRCA